MAIGLVFLGLGAAAVRINAQYIVGNPPTRSAGN
jgi:hypothetical protein